MSETKEQPKKKPELVKLPDLNKNFSELVRAKEVDSTLAFRFTLQSLDRLLHLYRFAKDDKSTDLQVFYHGGSLLFVKEQIDASKSGAVPVTLVKGTKEEAESVLFNLDYALLQNVQTTMKQNESENLVIEIKGNNSIEYIMGSFTLPGKLKDTVLEIPYSMLDETKLTSVLPVTDLNKILDISYQATESSHNALDNIFLDGKHVIGGTRGLLYRTDSLLSGLEELIGFNYKYYQDLSSFYSLVSGEVNINIGTSKIRGKVRDVIEFSSYDCRLVIPLSILTDGDKNMYNALSGQLDIEESGDNTQIHCTVKALRRSLNCMTLALYGMKTSHKTTVAVEGKTVTISAMPLTNEVAVDTLACNVQDSTDIKVSLGITYLFNSLASFENDDNIVLSIPKENNPSRVKLYGKTKSGSEKSWISSSYEL